MLDALQLKRLIDPNQLAKQPQAIACSGVLLNAGLILPKYEVFDQRRYLPVVTKFAIAIAWYQIGNGPPIHSRLVCHGCWWLDGALASGRSAS